MVDGDLGQDGVEAPVAVGRQDARGALVVHQHHLDAGVPEQADAAAEELLEFGGVHPAHRRVGAELPDHEVGPLGDRIAW